MKRTLIDTALAVFVGALLYFAVAGQARAQSGDPSGFTDQLNQERAVRGLPPVAHDSNAVASAQQNNSCQASYRQLGHFYTGGYSQCAAIGLLSPLHALQSWLASPAHAMIILSPTLRSIGYHQLGDCHTVSCSSGSVQPQSFRATQVYADQNIYVKQTLIYKNRPLRRFRFFSSCR